MKKPLKLRARATSKPVVKLLTRREYAARRGVTRQRIDRLVAQGRIPLTEDGMIDVVLADAQLEATIPEAAKAQNGKASPALEKLRLAQAARAETARRLLDLEYQRRCGKLMPADRVQEEWDRGLASLRTRLLAIPRAAAERLARAQTPAVCEVILRDAICEALADLSGTEYEGSAYVPHPPLVGSPEAFTYLTSGERIRIVLGQIDEEGNMPWLTSVNNGWVEVHEFYDAAGHKVPPPSSAPENS